MYEVLDESLRRAEMNHNITYGEFINKDDVSDRLLFCLYSQALCVYSNFI